MCNSCGFALWHRAVNCVCVCVSLYTILTECKCKSTKTECASCHSNSTYSITCTKIQIQIQVDSYTMTTSPGSFCANVVRIWVVWGVTTHININGKLFTPKLWDNYTHLYIGPHIRIEFSNSYANLFDTCAATFIYFFHIHIEMLRVKSGKDFFYVNRVALYYGDNFVCNLGVVVATTEQ